MNKQTIAGLFLATTLVGCNSDNNSSNVEPKETEITKLNIITANLWLSLSQNFNNESAFHTAVEEFKFAKADILLLSEASGISARLAESLGMYYWQGDDSHTTTGILSKYPIKSVFNDKPEDGYDQSGNIGAVLDVNGRDVVVWANHLDYTHYITYDARGGNGISWQAHTGCDPVSDAAKLDAMNAKSKRPAQTQYMLDKLAPYIKSGTPVFIGGDFNEASGLDWTADTANMFDHKGTVYDFSTHKMIRDAGLIDSYRALFPDPVSHPGITWPFHIKDSWTQGASFLKECGRTLDDRDRIDYIYHNANNSDLKLLSASIIGPKANTYFEGPHGEDSTYQWSDPHSGLMVNTHGTPFYGERDFVSDHLWYKTTYQIETPKDATATISLNLNPEFSNVVLRNDGTDLAIDFTISNFQLWQEDRTYRLVVSGDSTSSRTNGWQSEVLTARPNGKMTVTVPPSVLTKLKTEAQLHNGLQLRIKSAIGGWHKQYAVNTIATEEIEKIMTIPAL
ncbi:endonuclease/exonuclease/phosphatase family protein [Photobacterium sanguinicancri]|uniref:Endonuclease/exonuclease/phosphatase family protein n=1 Tax=Photobacterium sanguinicancri TaxID=875932 RepID=A0AAW7Y502_9GAMM|nr:endonuclease/exonuclease/phosphatase family protein [Photobacterium sanguinicancri]MDO6542072.1 endonuclease/exonuclease/phosphatase family protein [Photobacterium sanguinicancri]